MIIRIHPRSTRTGEPLGEALGRPVSNREGLTEHTVIAHWPGLDSCTFDGEEKTWTSVEWAQYLDDPSWQYPFAASLQDDRRAIWHADVRLHPSDRELTGPEWSEIAHRIARIAGIQRPGDESGCRWIAVQAQPGRLDLLANLIRSDGAWTTPSHRLLPLLAEESRRIEAEMDLISPRLGSDPGQAARFAARHTAAQDAPAAESVEATAQLAQLLRQLAAERTGPLATVRGLIEHTAYRLEALPHAYGPAAGHQLELIARRLYHLQEDLGRAASSLPATARPAPLAARPAPAAPAADARMTR